jgi:type I site-specific restriction endonuclease
MAAQQQPPGYTEEDIRCKVVLTWLAGLGFNPDDIRIEASFEVPLGRKRLKVDSKAPEKLGYLHPRADVLVRHIDGRNLLIVEVKSPDEPLDNKAREQGISYARLLQDGGIAPFVVLTNGLKTRIFDTITGETEDKPNG